MLAHLKVQQGLALLVILMGTARSSKHTCESQKTCSRREQTFNQDDASRLLQGRVQSFSTATEEVNADSVSGTSGEDESNGEEGVSAGTDEDSNSGSSNANIADEASDDGGSIISGGSDNNANSGGSGSTTDGGSVPFIGGGSNNQSKSDFNASKGKAYVEMKGEIVMVLGKAEEAAEEILRQVDDTITTSKDNEQKFKAKVAGASESDKVPDPMTGDSKLVEWTEKGEAAYAVATFYKMLKDNCEKVLWHITNARKEEQVLRSKIEVTTYEQLDRLPELYDEVEKGKSEAKVILRDAHFLHTQWNNSFKDYECGAPPAINHGILCNEGDTKKKPKCSLTCDSGYDAKGVRVRVRASNTLTCRKLAPFGKEVHGDWRGVASCEPVER